MDRLQQEMSDLDLKISKGREEIEDERQKIFLALKSANLDQLDINDSFNLWNS